MSKSLLLPPPLPIKTNSCSALSSEFIHSIMISFVDLKLFFEELIFEHIAFQLQAKLSSDALMSFLGHACF